MSETKVVVPDGMVDAVISQIGRGLCFDPSLVRRDLQAALRWLSEHPIVPTDEQYSALSAESTKYEYTMPSMKFAAVEWQRRMFRAAEPEVPEATRITGCVHGSTLNQPPCVPCAQAIEAYRRSK